MVIDYLEKLHHEMYEKKINLERESRKKKVLFEDNVKFIQTLENSLDENYESFSPREIEKESHLKIDSLLEEQQEIENEIEYLNSEILKLDEDISELENVLQIVRGDAKKKLDRKVSEKDKIYYKKILEIQDINNHNIIMSLHDYVMQNFTNIIHKIEICSKIMDVDTVRCRLELQTISKNIRDILQNMREVIYDLSHISINSDIDFVKAIENEFSKIRSENINVSCETIGEQRELSPIISLSLLRVIQESFENIKKHAKAKNVVVFIKYTDEKVKLIIQDDGVGFDTLGIKHLDKKYGSGFGISMMKERIYLLSGEVDVSSEPGKGTKVVVEIPMEEGG